MSDKNKKFMGMEVENKINIGDVLTLLGIFGAVVIVSFGVWRELYDKTGSNDRRIIVVEKELVNIKYQAERDRLDIKDDLHEIKQAIKDVSTQLNGKADKGPR